MANNPLGQYGYPSQKQITNQARNLAAASVTPASQIRRQYARSQTDASGFTQALISLLGGQQAQYNSAANDALTQQQAIDTSAASRLGGIAPEYQGAQIATGALGDSAAARQISQGEALKGYGAQQPGIAASRGALAQLGLTNAMQDALSQRRTQLQQAFQQALPQVQQNALGMATAAANIDQNRQQLALSYAQLNQQASQFSQSLAVKQQQYHDSLLAQYGFDSKTGQFVNGAASANSTQALSQKYGLTPNEIIGLQGHTSTQVEALLAQGYSWKAALQRAAANGVPPEIAKMSVFSIYSNPPPPPSAPNPNGYTNGANDPKYKADLKSYQTNLKAYKSAIAGFQSYIQSRQWRSFIREMKRNPDKPAGVAGGPGTRQP